ncbi:MAG TPA: amino acid adenylation domain-containing protein [Thermoanaerobaculia bacterium]|jgi:amino acid adenylation domain-containing protein/FkbM family methyltransferase|nr:amino acid adenylation domain-containing protein [Thermoanaerobaculia bacterium]
MVDESDKTELLAYLLAEEGLAETDTDSIRPRSGSDAAERPLSFSQRRLWFLDQMDPGNASYNMPAAVRLRGALDVGALERSLNAVVERHEALRTTFPALAAEPVQMVSAHLHVPLPVVDLAASPDRELLARRRIEEEANAPFDLTTGPLLRALLLRLAADEHLLVVTMHHIVSDGWSTGVFVPEMGALYDSFRAGRPSPLPPLPIQYADFAAWQRQWLAGERLERQLAYWRERLRDAPPLLELPGDRPRPPLPSFRGAVYNFDLPAEMTDGLRALARQQGATLFMVLLAGFTALLHRWSGEEQVVVGSSIANRNRVETEGLIGFFVNLLALRTDLSGDPSFVDLLARVRETTLGAYEHQDLPFDKLVEELQPQRHASYAPICQAVFGMPNAPAGELRMAGLELELVEVERAAAKYDLHLTLEERGGGLHGELEYATDLFDAATMARMAEQLGCLLAGAVARPATPVSELPLLTSDERDRLFAWSEAAPLDAQERLQDQGRLQDLFAAQVERTPDALAASCGGERLTYRELDSRSNRLARHLQALGVGAEVPVAVALERSLDTLVALLAVLKAGGAWVPLDPSYPASHLAFVLADTGAPVLVTRDGLGDRLPPFHGAIVRIDAAADAAAIAARGGGAVASPSTADNLFLVTYTSGSTGQPKGVAVSQRQFLNRFFWNWRDDPFRAGDVICQRTTIGFGISIWELLGGLLRGVPALIVPDEVVQDAPAFVRALAQGGVTHLVVVPSLLRMLLDADVDLAPLGRLRTVSACGEAFGGDLVERFYRRLPAATLRNHYGASEMHDAACHVVPSSAAGAARVPIGRPIANVATYVLDRRLQPQPVGVPGDLYVASPGLARGYLNRPELTAERFVPHPFQPGAVVFKTGDRARWLADGTLEYLGRRDHQVKVHGVLVETSGLEALLRRHPDVRQAAVVAREESPGQVQLTAYVVPRPERAATVGGSERYRLPNGLAVLQINRNETDFLYTEMFEEVMYLKHGITVLPGDTIFDVGANIGVFALWANLRSRGGALYAFEPNPETFAVLRGNSALHGVNAKLFPCALSSAAGSAPFTFYPGFTIMSGLYPDREEEKGVVLSYLHKQGVDEGPAEVLDELLEDRLKTRTFETPLRTLSEVIREQGVERIDLLKVNVEKAELDVLQGLDDADWPKVRQVVLQLHDVDGRLATVTSLLERHGFTVTVDEDFAVEASQHIHYLYAVREARQPDPEVEAAARGPQPDPILGAAELRRYLLERVPEATVPSRFVLLEAMPLTPNGKIDRRALPAVAERRATASVAPRTAEERAVAEIFAAVLRGEHTAVERLGVDDSFFELGGHSLLATQVVSRLRQAFAVDLPLRALFEAPTVAGVAAAVAAAVEKRTRLADDEALALLAEVERMSDAAAAAEHALRIHNETEPLPS